MRNRPYYIVLLQFLIHLFVLLLFFTAQNLPDFPNQWVVQFAGLLCLSLMFSIATIFFQSAVLHSLILFLRTMIFLLLGFPLGTNISIETVLLVSILFDMHMYLPGSVAFILSMLIILLAWSFQKSCLIWNMEQSSPPMSTQMLFLVFGFAVDACLFVLSTYTRKLARTRNILEHYEISISNLMEANLRLQNSIVTEITQATNNERKRIAQDLHDIIGHSMVNIMMITDSIKDRLNDREGIKSYCDVIHQQASGALSETENSMRTLRKQYDKRKYNSVAIKKLTSIFEKATGVEVLLEFRNAPTTFGEKIDRIVYRCIQEGLTNAFRHGRANRITILYWKHETGEMEITIKDNGKSVKNLNEGIGIWGMRERLSGIGGSITVNPSEFGFSLTLTFPFCTASDQEVVSDDRVGYC